MVDAQAPKSRERKRKSEVVTVRLDPRLKYLAELAARRQRRPLSSYIEWAIERSLAQVEPEPDPTSHEPSTFADVASELWDVDEPDRFAKLALAYPDLLDHDEQRLWKLIWENGALWRGDYGGPDKRWQWSVNRDSLIWKQLREHWDTFCRVADGELESSKLPEWQETDPNPSARFDREIPF